MRERAGSEPGRERMYPDFATWRESAVIGGD
jgi:hypothetical protein